MQAITLSHFRANLKKYFDQIVNTGDLLVVPGNLPEEAVVMMSVQEYNSMRETAHLLSTEANRNRLTASLKQAERGETVSFLLEPGAPQKLKAP